MSGSSKKKRRVEPKLSTRSSASFVIAGVLSSLSISEDSTVVDGVPLDCYASLTLLFIISGDGTDMSDMKSLNSQVRVAQIALTFLEFTVKETVRRRLHNSKRSNVKRMMQG